MNIWIGSDCVGTWSYFLPEDERQHDPLRQWGRLTPAALAVFDRLFSDRLLQCPLFLTLWIDDPGNLAQASRVQIDIREAVDSTVEHLLRAAGRRGIRLSVRGSSVVCSPSGERLLEDVLGVDVSPASYGSSISVWTLSDVWMPYDFQARPHPEVAALNAPRLKTALKAIERMLGVVALSEDSHFAKVDGYELRNHVVRGDVLDLQDMGYDASVIAEPWPDPAPAG
ncbi:MAG: hypothetical protein R3F43_00085 [bacterium]